MNAKERFLSYISFSTASDENSSSVPSTSGQSVLAKALAEELSALGLQEVEADDYGYVYGFLPASTGREDEPALGFLAHMDTSPEVSGENIKPYITVYNGPSITLPNGDTITEEMYPELEHFRGKEVIFTDGSTLLGADDKAGIAAIVTLCDRLISNPGISHRAIAVCFTPDEEIGRGPDHFDYAKFRAKEAYTVDGGTLGEIEYENFNAASAEIIINGINIHPGTAKNKMKNAVLMAGQFLAMLPPFDIPAETEGYEGFFHVNEIEGNVSRVRLKLIIRDHDRNLFEVRKAFLSRLAEKLNLRWGSGTIELTITDSYYNMREKLKDHLYLIENAEIAFRTNGIEPCILPIRGGTDGARLSWEGLPCPNLSTGGLNFHSRHECIPADAMDIMTNVLEFLVK
ncbi:MAG: peptidase T [Oscillospiraceae bacterium]|nr:peptidase T [Oscillospiraceae bacterium]